MQKEIQPKVNKITISCVSCGNEFEAESTKNEIKVDVCSNCHPFYTGKMTSAKKAGRVEKFKEKFGM